MRVQEPTLKQVTELYISSRQSRYAKNTTDRNRGELRHLTDLIGGDTKIKAVSEEQVDHALAVMATRIAPASYNNLMSTWGAFFDFCIRRGYRGEGRYVHPMGDKRRYLPVPPSKKARIPAIKFQSLLDASTHPRDRMIVALGLYLFLRQSEMVTLKLQDVSLADGEITVTVHKTNEVDIMPISAELDYELRRYLTWYTEHMGALDPQWYLVPSRYRNMNRGKAGRFTDAEYVLRPTRQATKVEEIAKAALECIGHPVRDEDGKALFEGIHTLRRSGARALFDDLRGQGFDGALQRVRSMLHHSSGVMTEKYLGINVERQQRNEAIRGNKMFTLTAENVVQIGGRDGISANVGM